MDASDHFTGTMAKNFVPCQDAPLSATELPLFNSSTVDFGQSRVAEEVTKLDGIQRNDRSPLETPVSSCKSTGWRTLSSSMNEGREPANDVTSPQSISSQPRMIRLQHQHNTTNQVTSLWPPPCADLSYNGDFPTGSPGSKSTQGNAMFRWMSTIKSKVNAIAPS